MKFLILILLLIGYGTGMTDENEPNEYGFAGDPSLPEPKPAPHLAEGEGERIAVPAGDLTGAITEAIDEATDRGDRDRD